MPADHRFMIRLDLSIQAFRCRDPAKNLGCLYRPPSGSLPQYFGCMPHLAILGVGRRPA